MFIFTRYGEEIALICVCSLLHFPLGEKKATTKLPLLVVVITGSEAGLSVLKSN